MLSTTTDHHYLESGLDNVVLANVPMHKCTGCGEELVELKATEGLHRAIALALISKRGPFEPREVKFLRKYLGYSNRDFARKMNVSPETASRWTSEANPMRMSSTAEQLLRVLVYLGEQIEQYTLEPKDEVTTDVIRLESRHGQWSSASDAVAS